MPLTTKSLLAFCMLLSALRAGAESTPRGAINAPDQRPKRVLVLNAYHLSHPWTEDVNRGLNEKFNASPFEVEVWTEFMETRRRPEAAQFDRVQHHISESYGHLRFDLILAVDDDAVRFLIERGRRLFGDVPVVYCGVSSASVLTSARSRGWTGVIEDLPVDPWVDLALRIRPANRRLVIVTDNSESNRLRRDRFKCIARERTGLQFEFLDGAELDFNSILHALRQVPPQAVVIATSYSKASSGAYVSPWEAGKAMAAASRAPILSPNSRYLGTGILAGNADAGHSHGLSAADLSLAILRDGKPPAAQSQMAPAAPVVDHSLLRKFRLTTDVWPEGTTFVNRHPTWRDFYLQYRWWIRGAALLILFQALVAAGLILSRRRLRKAEADLVRIRDRMARGQKIAHLGTWERNLTTGEISWSDEVFRIYGLEPGAITPSLDYVISAILPDDREEWKHAIEKAEREQTPCAVGYRIVRADGSIRHVRIHATQQTNAREERVLTGTVQDVTEVHEMEEQIRHAHRMESVGNLAGSLAHDFNNLLAVINGYSDLLLTRLPQDSSPRSAVNEIRKAGAKAADLTGKLLAFSRKEMMHPAPVDINDALLAMEGLLHPILGPHIRLHYDLQPGLPPAFLDQPHLEQSILNLASNSRDAMSGGGDFTIQTRLAASPGDSARSWIEIRVTDTGDGIDPETQKHIFAPFFTTKPRGKGTGLGLAGVYGFVRRSGGTVNVRSAPGAGTTMILRLPPIAPPDDLLATEASSP